MNNARFMLLPAHGRQPWVIDVARLLVVGRVGPSDLDDDLFGVGEAVLLERDAPPLGIGWWREHDDLSGHGQGQFCLAVGIDMSKFGPHNRGTRYDHAPFVGQA